MDYINYDNVMDEEAKQKFIFELKRKYGLVSGKDESEGKLNIPVKENFRSNRGLQEPSIKQKEKSEKPVYKSKEGEVETDVDSQRMQIKAESEQEIYQATKSEEAHYLKDEEDSNHYDVSAKRNREAETHKKRSDENNASRLNPRKLSHQYTDRILELSDMANKVSKDQIDKESGKRRGKSFDKSFSIGKSFSKFIRKEEKSSKRARSKSTGPASRYQDISDPHPADLQESDIGEQKRKFNEKRYHNPERKGFFNRVKGLLIDLKKPSQSENVRSVVVIRPDSRGQETAEQTVRRSSKYNINKTSHLDNQNERGRKITQEHSKFNTASRAIDAMKRAEVYRKAARKIDVEEKDHEKACYLYEEAIAIMDAAAITSSRYYGKLLFGYGVALSKNGRSEIAREQFAHAKRLGFSQFDHDVAPDLTILR